MTLPRLAALNREWRRCPPARALLAAYVGYKPPPKPRRMKRSELKGLLGRMKRGA